MSYTTVKAIWPGEKVEDLKELRNGHGSGPAVWNALCMKYLNVRDMYWATGDLDRLWKLWKDPTIPSAHRAVLMMTFDMAYIAKKDYARAAMDIRTFQRDLPPHPERVNHWPKIAEILEGDPDIPAIGLQCTSVSDDLWQGPWNEEKEEHDPLDWSKAYSIYDKLDAIAKAVDRT